MGEPPARRMSRECRAAMVGSHDIRTLSWYGIVYHTISVHQHINTRENRGVAVGMTTLSAAEGI